MTKYLAIAILITGFLVGDAYGEKYKGFNFSQEDLLRFKKYDMDVQNAIDAGGTLEEIVEASKNIEQEELLKKQQTEQLGAVL